MKEVKLLGNINFKEMLLDELNKENIKIKEIDIEEIVSNIIKEIDVKS